MSEPALRFKDDDGRDFPDWEETSLGNICKPQQWKTIAASELTQFGYPAYGANGQIGFYSDYNHEDETVAVTCRGATCGEVSLIPPKSYITGNAMSLDGINHKNNNHRFVYYALIHRGFRDVISGSAQPQIVGSAIRKVEFAIPTLAEQAKIANFLTAVDEKITQLTQKNDLLSQYKKGVMQQIFSQELRFKDEGGADFPEWEESKLGEISSFFSGGTPLTTKSDFYGGEIPFIKSGEISDNKTAQFITESGLKNSSAKMVLKGDLLYALYGATSGEVAISKIEGAINQAVLCIRSKLNTYFLLSYFLFEKQNILQTYLQGGQGNLSAEIIKSLIVPIPSILEQTKIANFLIAIDAKINTTQTQLQAVKQYKQGLLQQMFV
jgi:restriction endonuclease S subunit